MDPSSLQFVLPGGYSSKPGEGHKSRLRWTPISSNTSTQNSTASGMMYSMFGKSLPGGGQLLRERTGVMVDCVAYKFKKIK